MAKTRSNKFIALLLCFAMVATSVVQFMVPMTVSAATGMTIVDEEGTEVNEISFAEDEKVNLYVKGNLAEEVQWQIYAEEYDMWVDILGETSEGCSLSYAKVANMLNKKDETKVRCTEGEGDSLRSSNEVNISIDQNEQEGELAPIAMFSMKSAKAVAANDNIMLAAEGEEETTPDKYSVVINYIYENGDIASAAYAASLAAGSNFTQTIANPKVQGYAPTYGQHIEGVLFTSENVTLNIENISEDLTINVVYQPTNVNYTIIYYHQNIDNDNYVVHETEVKQAKTNSVITKVEKEYPGFYQLVYEQPTVAADGTTVVEVYYDRQYYLMFFEMSGGYGVDPIYARYGTSIGDVGTPTRAGYTFAGWAETEGGDTKVDLPDTMPAESRTYYAIWTPDSTAKVSVVFWGENADDEEYSYLDTTEIYVKPGTEFTYSEGKSLICGVEEHTHGAGCAAACGQTAHSHGASCYELICTKEEHTSHTDACYTCNIENHTHGTGCYAGVGNSQTVYTGLPENPSNGQVVDHWVYHELIYISGNWYRYSGGTSAGNIAPTTCGKTEQTHTHTDACIGCGKELHTHTDYTGSCYELTCTTPEHSHSDACGYSCGKAEHTHSSSCYMPTPGLDNALWKFVKSDTVTVAADGSTVVNVYYDRTTFTMTFKKTGTNGDTLATITEKWGADIKARFESISKANTFLWSASTDGNSPWTSFVDVMPKENRTYYAKTTTSSNTQTATYYGERIDGSGYDVLYTVEVKYGNNLTVSKEEFEEIEGFVFNASKSTKTGSAYNGAKFYYDRASFVLTFNDGYESVENKVKYEAPLSTYKDYKPDAPSAYEPGSVQFAGWYLNPECTGVEFDFDTHNMPAKNLILYAKWIPVTHQVTFYKNAEDLASGTKYKEPIPVQHGQKVPEAPEFEGLVDGLHFVGWFYIDNGVEKAFDFEGMPVTKDMDVYGKWSSNSLVEYKVYYKTKDGKEIAIPTTGSGLAGNTKTFDAKGGTELYADYQEGWFPVPKSHSITLNAAEGADNSFTFVYEQKDAVPYTVKYLEEGTDKVLNVEKKVSDNRKAVVTETFVPISGYMPDAYQKRLVVNIEDGAVNEIIFYYSKDEEHAYYKISHYTQNTDGVNYTEYASSEIVGTIGKTYTAEALTIPGFEVATVNDAGNGYVTLTEGELTSEGLHLKIYYNRIAYPYIVMHQEQGSGKILADPDSGKAMYGKVVGGKAKSFVDYTYVSSSPEYLTIMIEDVKAGEDPELNVIHMYYKENQVKINYKADPESGGTVSDESETLNVLTGYAKGSTATPNSGYEFVGWYDEANKKVSSDRTYVPAKVKGTDGIERNVSAKYTAKFAEKNVEFNYVPVGPDDATNFGTVDSAKETVKAVSGTAVGSTATAGEGYTFVGWYAEETCENLISNGAKYVPVKTDGVYLEGGTFYAKFVENDVTINYVAEAGGTVNKKFETLKIYTGEPQGSEATPAKGYKFIGWYDAGGNKVSDNEKFIPAKLDGKNIAATYKAKFEELTTDIHYVLVGDTEGAKLTSSSENNEGTIGVISGPVKGSEVIDLKKGYTFEGWFTDEACNNAVSDADGIVQGNRFTPNQKDGLYEAATYYAKIVEDTIEIKYEVIGPTGENFGAIDITSEGTVGVATGPVRGSTATPALGYEFLGWYDNSNGTGDPITIEKKLTPTKAMGNNPDLYEEATYYAIFEQTEVTINYVAVGPDGVTDFGSVTPGYEKVKAVTETASGSTPTAGEGYEFAGWYEDANCKDSVETDDGTVVGDKFTPTKQGGVNVGRTYYAKFIEKEATFNYIPVTSDGTNLTDNSFVGGKINGKEETVTETVKVKTETVSGATASANEDYEFKGWYEDAGCTDPVDNDDGTVVDGKFTPAKNSTYAEGTHNYYALFEEKNVQIEYMVKDRIGGKVNLKDLTNKELYVSEVMRVKAGEAKGAEATADPGYVFAGWYNNEACLDAQRITENAVFVPNKVDDKNVAMTYYAKFVEAEVEFKYLPVTVVGGTVSLSKDPVRAVSGEPKTVTATAKEGYTFGGWYLDEDCSEKVPADIATVNDNAITPVKQDGIYVSDTFYAKFTENKVTLNYIPVTYKGGVPTDEPNEGGQVGSADGTFTEQVLTSTGIAEGTTAQAKENYVFAGWYSDPECTVKISDTAAYVPTKAANEFYIDGTSYYARFDEAEVTISYKVVDPEGAGEVDPTEETVKIFTGKAEGSTAKVLNNDYAFVGWYKDSECEVLVSRNEHFVPEKADGKNVAATYYAKFEEAVTFTYVAVPDLEKGDVGTVSLIGAGDKLKNVSEQVGRINDVPIGATANGNPEKGFKFVGWYLDEECTQPVTSAEANVDGNEIIPVKQGDKYVGGTFYAKFSSSLPHLTISKTGVEAQDSGDSFLFEVTGPKGFQTTVVIKGNGSVTLKNLEVGAYTVREITSWNIDYTPDEKSKVTNIETYTDDKSVSFENTIKTPTWLDGSVTLLNLFTPHGIEQYSE